ncbi:MAG: hypothetical protein MI924_38205 [Chloroflexales bacterium]|nr:hypothetical protein [Chloroflexales bacterium]
MSDQTAARQAPTYTARSSAIAQLLAVADQLPAGPVLLLDVSPVSDLLHRARYRFYPRRVDVRSPQQVPAAIPQLLTTHYTAAIQATPTDQPPAPGWVRVAAPAGPLAVWRAPVATWPAAGAPLLAGLVLVGVVGWACAGALGWPGRLAIGAAWPLGAALLAGERENALLSSFTVS